MGAPLRCQTDLPALCTRNPLFQKDRNVATKPGSGKWLSLNTKMPVPSRKARDGTAGTKPPCDVGARFCRGRPFFGRAAVGSIQCHGVSPFGSEMIAAQVGKSRGPAE